MPSDRFTREIIDDFAEIASGVLAASNVCLETAADQSFAVLVAAGARVQRTAYSGHYYHRDEWTQHDPATPYAIEVASIRLRGVGVQASRRCRAEARDIAALSGPTAFALPGSGQTAATVVDFED